MTVGAIILAAGEGKRMKSNIAKVLHDIDGVPMVEHVIKAARKTGPKKIVIVAGNRMEQVIACLHREKVIFAVQEEQRGTADAVKTAKLPFANFEGEILVLCGDMPLVRGETLVDMLEYHRKKGASATVMTGILDDPAKYGRIIRGENGDFDKIVEYADADENIRAIKEVNSGTYVFDFRELWPALEKISSDNAQGEFYLTDVMTVLKDKGKTVVAYTVKDSSELLGVNTKEQLVLAEEALKRR